MKNFHKFNINFILPAWVVDHTCNCVMQQARRKFLKNASLLMASAVISGGVLGKIMHSPVNTVVKIVPVAGEHYGPAMSALMAERRFDTPQAAIRAVKNQRVRFALEVVAA